MANAIEAGKQRVLRVSTSSSRNGREFSVDVPRRHYHGRKNLRWGESGQVTAAMEQLAADAGRGTNLTFRDFSIHDVRIINGQEQKPRKLRRWPSGWEKGTFWFGGGGVRYDHERNLQLADRSIRHLVSGTQVDITLDTGERSKRLKGNPIEVAIKREEAVRKALTKHDTRYKVYKRASWVAKIAEANPLKFQRDFALGNQPETIGDNIYYMMLNIGDWQLDPQDRIQGPIQNILNEVEKLQEHPVLGTLFANLFGKHQERVDRVIASATKGNKYTSRDIRRPPARLARMLAFDWAYTHFRQGELLQHMREVRDIAKEIGKAVVGKDGGKEGLASTIFDILNRGPKTQSGFGARIRRTVLPAEAPVEEARDVRTNQGNLVGFAFVDTLLAIDPTEMKSDAELYHQHVIAEQFIEKYKYLSPFDARMQKITEGITKGLHGLIDVSDIAVGVRDKAKAAVNDALKTAMERGKVADSIKSGITAVKEEIRKPSGGTTVEDLMSTKHQVDDILARAEGILSNGSLTPVERIRWQEAFYTAQLFDSAYKRAQAIVAAHAASQQ